MAFTLIPIGQRMVLYPRSGRANMQRVNEFSFYELAEKVHPLANLSYESALKISTVWLDWWQARQAIDTIFSLRPFHVCVGAADKLRRALTDVIPEKWEDLTAILPSNPAEEKNIAPWQIGTISQAVAVGTSLAARPPRRSVQAELPHTALTKGGM